LELTPPLTVVKEANTHRLIPSVYPPTGLFDDVASPDDLQDILELEGWTNDRISGELGLLNNIPRNEWVIGAPNATAIMAAYCHPHPSGGRFNDNSRGAWYTAFDLDTALKETIFHRTQELREIGVFETFIEMRQYLSDFHCEFHDVREQPTYDKYHNPNSYAESQALGAKLLREGSNGVIYRSVRNSGGCCITCFRPALVLNVRMGAHFEYRWEGKPQPTVTELRVD
jgi:RES domain-containing protein